MQDVNMYSQAESDLDSYGFGFNGNSDEKPCLPFASTWHQPHQNLNYD